MLRYNPSDWYWQITGDPLVWSSARFQYVDRTVDPPFQQWATLGGLITPIDSMDSLGAIMAAQVIPPYLMANGLQVSSTGTPALNSTYGLDDSTLNQIGTLARDTACGFGFPRGQSSFDYPDSFGNQVNFTPAQIQSLYVAMRDYIAGVNLTVAALVHRQMSTLPTQPVAIA
jgi:hypothetical protein